MAAKQPKPPATVKERQALDRVQRAKRSYPRLDRHGAYLELCAGLAQETGGSVEAIYDELTERATSLLYTGEYDTEDAENLAWVHTSEAYRRAS